ncbi:MAG: hydroxymethylbilane synthase [Bacteroidetes bacterium]|nr:hydroxymethylbilane synthase [Bacteroidota bacterium]MDA1119554.1 hydroxymethylbilane synthase [Bacteroidota bacterium]
MATIKIGTRHSSLAIWQANYVAGKLLENGLNVEILPFETKGDKIIDVSISKIGSKGVFTEELERALLTGEIDIAVHSAKDLQSSLSDDLEIIAFCEREIANDVLISTGAKIGNISEIKIGTSSTRRVALLKRYHPGAQVVNMRGNIQTRISKMEAGICDVLMLAYAGVHRMGLDDKIIKVMPENQFVPAVGQGSIAVEASKNLDAQKKRVIRSLLNHEDTACCISAERAFLKKLEGGCSIPVFANATLNEGQIEMVAGIVSLDGSQILMEFCRMKREDHERLGLELAEKVLSQGGDKILMKIREKLSGR